MSFLTISTARSKQAVFVLKNVMFVLHRWSKSTRSFWFHRFFTLILSIQLKTFLLTCTFIISPTDLLEYVNFFDVALFISIVSKKKKKQLSPNNTNSTDFPQHNQQNFISTTRPYSYQINTKSSVIPFKWGCLLKSSTTYACS